MTITDALLLHLLVAEVIVLLLVAAIMFGHALWLRWRVRRDTSRLEHARAAMIAAVDQSAPDDEPLDDQLRHTLDRLSYTQQVSLIASLASNLNGRQRAMLTACAIDLGLAARAEKACRSRFWWRRLHGCRVFTLIDAGESVVPSLFTDRNPDVRAQAAEWAAAHPDPEIVAALVDRLAAPTDLCRFSVQDSLLRLGGCVIEPLAAYLNSHHGQPAIPALEVAIGLADPRLLAPALTLCRDAKPRARALAATVVGALGGDESTAILIELLEDPAAEVRAAAAEGLGRLGHVASAPALAIRLRDHAWDVRRAAGLALRAFGAPGLLYLRRALKDADPFAADMAHQLLDISALNGEAV